MAATRIIGIGNPDRGDDAVGPAVIAALAGRVPPAVVLETARGDMLALMQDWDAATAVILVDAMTPGGAPGRVTRLDAGGTVVAAGLASFASSHAFDLAGAIELARALGRLPPRLVAYGIEGAEFTHGAPLSGAVAAAVPEVVRLITRALSVCTKPH